MRMCSLCVSLHYSSRVAWRDIEATNVDPVCTTYDWFQNDKTFPSTIPNISYELLHYPGDGWNTSTMYALQICISCEIQPVELQIDRFRVRFVIWKKKWRTIRVCCFVCLQIKVMHLTVKWAPYSFNSFSTTSMIQYTIFNLETLALASSTSFLQNYLNYIRLWV